MRAMAPGKLVLTGAYAVLEGAPAIVAAVDRYAFAEAARDAPGEPRASEVDVRALQDAAGRKLGLGSSAAAVVASLGARALAHGEDLSAPEVRQRIFLAARDAHARKHGGGSGVDVAASVHGGVSRYRVDENGLATIEPVDLPAPVCLAAYDSGSSMRTSDMLARFDRLRSTSAAGVLSALRDLAHRASCAIDAADARALIACAREFGEALAALGEVIDAPVVPPRFAELASLAAREHAAFLPSGAGGGDVGIWLGLGLPSTAFASRARALAMHLLPLGIDRGGLRPEPSS